MERTGEALIDVAIIGGGPAGTAVAIEARRRGLRVAIWERDRFPRDKVCGGFLSPESLPLLERLIPEAFARAAPIRRSEFIPLSGHARGFTLPAPGRGLSRVALDAALWNVARAAGAQTHQGEAIRGLRKAAPACWEAESASGTVERARALIIACGRWWTLEGFPSPAREQTNFSPWLGAKAHFRGLARRDVVEMYAFSGGYCGLAPIEGGLYNACCLVHRDLVRGANGLEDFTAWLRGVTGHPALEARLRGATQASETIATAPLRPGWRSATHDGALLVGDAAGFLDPFTGDGISIALHSGTLAATELASAFSKGVQDLQRIAFSYGRGLRRAVGRSYMIAGLFRGLVRGPAFVQASAAAALPWLGERLHAETRWRA